MTCILLHGLSQKVGMSLGIVVGLIGGALVSGVAAFCPQLLTHDTALWPLLGQVVLQALVSMVFTGIDVCGCAINIAVGGCWSEEKRAWRGISTFLYSISCTSWNITPG